MKKIVLFMVALVLLAGCGGAKRELKPGVDFCSSDMGVKWTNYFGKGAGSGGEIITGEVKCENKIATFDFIYSKDKINSFKKLAKSEKETLINLDVTRIKNNMCIDFANPFSKSGVMVKPYMLNGKLDNVHVNLKQLDGKVINSFDVNADVCKFR